MIRNKLAISAIVGEVLLISLAMVMAGAVYAWLKFYVSKPLPHESCDEAVSLIIDDSKCLADKTINITFRNMGRFDINGVMVKVSNESGKELAIWPLTEIAYNIDALSDIDTGKIHAEFNPVLAPGDYQSKRLNYSRYNHITYIELEPTKGVDKYGRMILCEKSISRMPLVC